MNHQGPIAGIAATDRYIATAGYDNRLILWDGATGRALARGLHDHLVNDCAFSAGGTLLASASSDYSARLWEVPSLRLKAVLAGHDDDVDMAVFSPDDARVATCALDRRIRIFDTAGHCLQVLSGHQGNILAVAWSRDGTRLVSSGVDGTVREWDAATGRELRCNRIDVRTDTLAIDGAGRIIAGDDQGRIAMIVGGAISFTQAHRAGIKKLVFDQAAAILVTLSYDRTLAVWSLRDGSPITLLARTELPVIAWARAAALIGGSRVAVGSFGARCCVYDWASGLWDAGVWDAGAIQPGPGLNAVAVVAGTRFAIGDAGILLRDGAPATRLGSLCNFLLPAGARLFTGGQLGQLFDAQTGELLHQHHSPLNCGAAFQRAGQPHLVIGSYTGEALVFVLEDAPRLIATLKLHDNAIKGLVASEDQIFSVCASTDIAWVDIEALRLSRLVRNAHERIANGCCRAGPTGFASVGRDRMLRLWADGREEAYPTPHPNSVKCIASSDDRTRLMTGAYTGTLAGFDLATRSWVSFARPTQAGISSIAYDPGRRCFLASSYDGSLHDIA